MQHLVEMLVFMSCARVSGSVTARLALARLVGFLNLGRPTIGRIGRRARVRLAGLWRALRP